MALQGNEVVQIRMGSGDYLQRVANTTGKMQVQGKRPWATLHYNNRSDKWDSKPRFQTTAQGSRQEVEAGEPTVESHPSEGSSMVNTRSAPTNPNCEQTGVSIERKEPGPTQAIKSPGERKGTATAGAEQWPQRGKREIDQANDGEAGKKSTEGAEIQVWNCYDSLCWADVGGGFEAGHERKQSKYSDLAAESREASWYAVICSLEVRYRGFVGSATSLLLCNLRCTGAALPPATKELAAEA